MHGAAVADPVNDGQHPIIEYNRAALIRHGWKTGGLKNCIGRGAGIILNNCIPVNGDGQKFIRQQLARHPGKGRRRGGETVCHGERGEIDNSVAVIVKLDIIHTPWQWIEQQLIKEYIPGHRIRGDACPEIGLAYRVAGKISD